MNSVLAIENNRESNLILNPICDILADLYNQGKHLKVPAHMETKGNEESDKTAKKAISTRYVRNDHDKTTSYRLLPDH